MHEAALAFSWLDPALNLDLNSGALLSKSQKRLPVEIQSQLVMTPGYLFHKGQPHPTSSGYVAVAG